MYFAGITDHPSGVWASQAARNLLLQYGHQLADARALVRDSGSQSIDAFDEIFRTERMKVLKTPVRTPVANAFAERWIPTDESPWLTSQISLVDPLLVPLQVRVAGPNRPSGKKQRRSQD